MLRVVSHQSAAAAKAYYAEGLKREDYYAEKQEIIGQWLGLAAERLGLSGKVTSETFAMLAENRHPTTGERLTPRTKHDRIVGYDLNLHAPKSLSVLHAFTGDQAILRAFRQAVAETMSSLEKRALTRIRQGGTQNDRLTGNLAWAEFIHLTARPVGGIPDPHLHAHCFAFNSTFDGAEGRWKAAKFHAIKQEAPYFEALFHSRLTEKLASLGYGIERTRTGWEVAGIPPSVLVKFSRRTAQIEEIAAKKGITDAKAKDALGAASRAGKRRGLTNKQLLSNWQGRLTTDELAAIRQVAAKQPVQQRQAITATAALDYAAEKLFARHSVVEKSRLVAEALRFGVGALSLGAVEAEFGRRGMIERTVQGQRLCTSLDALAEEVSLIRFVRTGRGLFAPLAPRHTKFADERLSKEQRAAVRYLLTSQDQVITLRGAAGVGKTTLMQEAVTAIEMAGNRVFALAPSAAASRGTLREAGFAGAQTVAHFLSSAKLQSQVRGQVIWIDEAGLLGVRDLWRVVQAAGPSTRLILTGDTQQHAPVARGDAFRLLQTHAGLPVAEVTRIRRQEAAEYRKAISYLSKGDLAAAFQQLDALGAIVEVPGDIERYRLLAADYLALSRGASTPLVVSPTHAEGGKVTAAIREARQTAGHLKRERSFIQYQALGWEEADRGRADWYEPGLLVQFHQHAPGIRRGELLRVTNKDARGSVWAENKVGGKVAMPLEHADRFQVFEERQISLAKGDRIRITRNGESADGRKINNGALYTIESINKKGQLVLHSGAVLNPDHGHLAYGYCTTSHSSQSKTVQDVLVAQSASSFVASSQEQFYVSASRGKQSIRIYTDDRAGLQVAVGNRATRTSALEFAGLGLDELVPFLGMELNAKAWRESIQSRRAVGESKNFVANLLKDRRVEASTQKSETMSWRGYVEARRNNVTADGKSRSKGYSGGEGKKPGFTKTNERSFVRPTSPTDATLSKIAEKQQPQPAKAAALPKVSASDRTAKLATAFKAAGTHFKSVFHRGERQEATLPTASAERKVRLDKQQGVLPKSQPERSAQHASKQRSAEVVKQPVKTPAKVQTPVAVRRR